LDNSERVELALSLTLSGLLTYFATENPSFTRGYSCLIPSGFSIKLEPINPLFALITKKTNIMLVLLADTRKKFLWLWLGFTAFIVLLIIAQTLTSKFEGIEIKAWVWTFANLLPVLLLLLSAVLLNKNPSKVLFQATFRTIFFASLAYLIVLILTLFAIPYATQQWSIEAYFSKSYLWLMPFQAVLLIAFGILYFKKETLFQPDPDIMLEYVGKKGEFAKRKGNIAQAQAFEGIHTENGMADVLNILQEKLPADNNDIVLLESQFADWKRQRDLNLTSEQDLQRTYNRLTLAVINYIEKL
jgi:hypothetical protein